MYDHVHVHVHLTHERLTSIVMNQNLESISSKNQEPIYRYLKHLPTLQQQIEPRGVGINPVYNDGIGAFGFIDSTYLDECMEPEELILLKGFRTSLVSFLNRVFFGKVTQCGFIINSNQEDQFARMVLRLHLISDLKIWLIDPSKIKKFEINRSLIKNPIPIIDLRKYPLKSIRKLLRWKKEYSPVHDGLILYDLVDAIIDNTSEYNNREIKRSSASKALEVAKIGYKVTDTLKWTVLFNKQQNESFTSDQREQFGRCQDDYRKWSLFCKDLGNNMVYTMRLEGKIEGQLLRKVKESGYTVKYYPKEKVSFLTPPYRYDRKFSVINSDLDRKLMLRILEVLHKPNF